MPDSWGRTESKHRGLIGGAVSVGRIHEKREGAGGLLFEHLADDERRAHVQARDQANVRDLAHRRRAEIIAQLQHCLDEGRRDAPILISRAHDRSVAELVELEPSSNGSVHVDPHVRRAVGAHARDDVRLASNPLAKVDDIATHGGEPPLEDATLALEDLEICAVQSILDRGQRRVTVGRLVDYQPHAGLHERGDRGDRVSFIGADPRDGRGVAELEAAHLASVD